MGNNKRKMENKSEDAFEKAFGVWKDAGIEDSVEYVRKIREGWEKRAKRLGLK